MVSTARHGLFLPVRRVARCSRLCHTVNCIVSLTCRQDRTAVPGAATPPIYEVDLSCLAYNEQSSFVNFCELFSGCFVSEVHMLWFPAGFRKSFNLLFV